MTGAQTLSDQLFPKGTLRRRLLMSLRAEGLGALVRLLRHFARKTVQAAQLTWWSTFGREAVKRAHPASLSAQSGPIILCLPVIDWETRFQRPQQLLMQFARADRTVLYARATFAGFGRPDLGIRRLAPNVYEMALPGDRTLALYRDLLAEPTLTWSRRALQAFLESNHLEHLVCLVHHPFWMPLALWLRETFGAKLVYDCLDDLAAFEVAHPDVAQRDAALASASDIVLATSHPLLDRLKKVNPHCVLLPNAADFDHFSTLPSRDLSPVASLPRPVIGYYGAISEWFDAEAVRLAALERPAWSFVLVGDCWGAHLDRLRRLPNVHLLGEKPYSALPSCLSGFDVCTIPFLITPLTSSTNPVKLYEYFSTGKPVVASALPELESLGDLVSLYRDPVEFARCIESALANDSADKQHRRREYARSNTWSQRYREMSAAIDALGPP